MPARRVTSLLAAGLVFVISSTSLAQKDKSPRVASEAPPSPITNAAAIRSLEPEVAARRLPVRLQGIVTFIFNPNSCFVQDQTAGIYVGNGIEVGALEAGDIVSLEGVTDPGDYAPLIRP